jgi:hypothetical protein
MLQNGLYSISFKSDVGNAEGSGVIVLLNGVLLGGDDALLYTGSYQQRANRTREHKSAVSTIVSVFSF